MTEKLSAYGILFRGSNARIFGNYYSSIFCNLLSLFLPSFLPSFGVIFFFSDLVGEIFQSVLPSSQQSLLLYYRLFYLYLISSSIFFWVFLYVLFHYILFVMPLIPTVISIPTICT